MSRGLMVCVIDVIDGLDSRSISWGPTLLAHDKWATFARSLVRSVGRLRDK